MLFDAELAKSPSVKKQNRVDTSGVFPDQGANAEQLSESQSTRLLLNMLDEMSPKRAEENTALESKASSSKTVFHLTGNYVPAWMRDHGAEPIAEVVPEQAPVLTDTQLLEKLLEEGEEEANGSAAARRIPQGPPPNNISSKKSNEGTPQRGVIWNQMLARRTSAKASEQGLLDILHDKIARHG